MLPLRFRLNLGAMAMKRYSVFPKAPYIITIRLFSVISEILVGRGYSSAEMKLVYSIAPVDWAVEKLGIWGRIVTIQTTALLRSTRILRRILETCYRSDPKETPPINTDVKKLARRKIIMVLGPIILKQKLIITQPKKNLVIRRQRWKE